jgi:hypothetical protein
MADSYTDGIPAGPAYINTTNHAASLTDALDAYTRALTRRWRELVARSIDIGEWDGIPASARGSTWDFTSPSARAHILDRGATAGISGCDYLNWVLRGQVEPLDSITCDGRTGRPGADPALYPTIPCGVGSILRQVADWAYEERQVVLRKLPLFDRHDVAALHTAHDALISIGGQLGLEAGAHSDRHVLAGIPEVGLRPIPERVSQVADEDDENTDWWAGWTGLAADRARDGFFASVRPTMFNQAGVAGWLANLYTCRAAIIEKGRNDALYWIRWATGSLDEKELFTVDLVDGWKAVQGIGMLVSAAAGWTATGAVVGATIQLVGFLGEQVFPTSTTEQYAHDIWRVMSRLRDEIDDLNVELDGLESDYWTLRTRVQGAINGADSYNLELYDLTCNEPDGTRQPGQTGFQVNVDVVLGIARNCYELAKEYAKLLPFIKETAAADASLANAEGRPTATDERVLELRNLLEEFLRTTSARFQLAGEQTQAAAEAYVDVDESQREMLIRILNDWRENGVGSPDLGFDPEEQALETGRHGLPGATDTSREYGVTTPSERRMDLADKQEAHRELDGGA